MLSGCSLNDGGSNYLMFILRFLLFPALLGRTLLFRRPSLLTVRGWRLSNAASSALLDWPPSSLRLTRPVLCPHTQLSLDSGAERGLQLCRVSYPC